MTREEVFAAYESIRPHLPAMPDHRRIEDIQSINSIMDTLDDFDVYLFDAFGVLNRGAEPIGDALNCIASLREAGKHIFVVSNAASRPKPGMILNYRRMGFDFSAEEIISSRDTVLSVLPRYDRDMTWGLIAPDLEHFDLNVNYLRQDEEGFADTDGFLFLSTLTWDDEQQEKLMQSLKQNIRPVVLGNPDMIAPHPDHISIEPGAYMLRSDPEHLQHIEVCGKPFPRIFELVIERIEKQLPEFDKNRVLMLGDTLHTDILGAAAIGFRTVLVTDFGFFRDLDYLPFINSSQIIPDYTLSSL